MVNSWKNNYLKLAEFIGLHNEIEISSNKVVIPSGIKDEFYRYFDSVRETLITESFPHQLDIAEELSRNFKEIRGLVLESEAIDSIDISGDLNWFLENPTNGLTRYLFDPLMKLLAGTSNPDEFEAVSITKLNQAFCSLFSEGYNRYIELGLIYLFKPDAGYFVPAIDGLENGLLGEGHELPGQHIDRVPWPQKSNRISFDQYPVMSFIVPNILLHSAGVGSFVAMHFDFREAEWTASKISENMEWHKLCDIKRRYGLSKLRPDLFKKAWYEFSSVLPDLAIYTAPELNDLALVADYNHLLRPEVNVEIMAFEDWYKEGRLADVKKHHEAMKPKKGSYIVCLNETPLEVETELIGEFRTESGIRIIHSGYDYMSLESIVSSFAAASPINQISCQ